MSYKIISNAKRSRHLSYQTAATKPPYIKRRSSNRVADNKPWNHRSYPTQGFSFFDILRQQTNQEYQAKRTLQRTNQRHYRELTSLLQQAKTQTHPDIKRYYLATRKLIQDMNQFPSLFSEHIRYLEQEKLHLKLLLSIRSELQQKKPSIKDLIGNCMTLDIYFNKSPYRYATELKTRVTTLTPRLLDPLFPIQERVIDLTKTKPPAFLDLDQTLLHSQRITHSQIKQLSTPSTLQLLKDHKIQLKLTSIMSHGNYMILFRPGLSPFLETLGNTHNIIFYTAAHKDLAKDYYHKTLQQLYPYPTQLLHRDHCLRIPGNSLRPSTLYIKVPQVFASNSNTMEPLFLDDQSILVWNFEDYQQSIDPFSIDLRHCLDKYGRIDTHTFIQSINADKSLIELTSTLQESKGTE